MVQVLCKEVFQPVTIILESKFEVELIKQLLGKCTPTDEDMVFLSKLYDKLKFYV